MDPNPRHRAAERRFRQLLEDSGLEAPDRVEYDAEEMVFFWEEQKLAVVVELDGADVVNGASARSSSLSATGRRGRS